MVARRVISINDIAKSATRLTDAILENSAQELSDILRTIAAEIGLKHIAYLRYEPTEGREASLSTAVATYSNAWQTRYFDKSYDRIDPVLVHGRSALLPFDWSALASDEPALRAFFADALAHGVGSNGLSIPVRNRTGARSLASFTSDHSKADWAQFKEANIAALQNLSLVIDAAWHVLAKVPLPTTALSRRESECLIWAARGKSVEETGRLLDLGSALVKAHLDAARHKLYAIDLRQAIAIAIAIGAIPAR
jgi:DNA-binding CsgD family transcriptional regulator